MTRRLAAAMLMLLFSILFLWAASASGGTAEDPVVSQSYVDGTFKTGALSSAQGKIASAFGDFVTKYITQAQSAYSAASARVTQSAVINAAAESALQRLQAQGKYLFNTRSMAPVVLKKDDVIYGAPGTTVILLSGTSSSCDGSVINITTGKEIAANNALGRFTTFMFTEKKSGIRITSASANAMIDGAYAKASAAYVPKYYKEAYKLKSIGLVRGAAKGLELARPNTRAESITMLIRLLGEENTALSQAWTHPFGDVAAWAQRYVGYGYKKGYTNGVSATRYDGTSSTTASHYMTFILRALGYNDASGDFAWNTAMKDAVRLGVITESERKTLESEQFCRDQVMYISYRALFAYVKGESRTLLAKLIDAGAVTSDADDILLS